MFIFNRFPFLIDEPGVGAGPPAAAPATPEAPPKDPTFDDVAKGMFQTMQSEMAKAEVPEAAPATPPPAAPIAEPTLAAPAFAPPPAAAPPAGLDGATLALLQQMQQTQAQLLERTAPKVEQPTAKPVAPPTIKEAMRDYQAPAKMAGEDDASYSMRNQANVLDHWNAKNAEWMRGQSAEIARNAVAEYQQQMQQHAYVARAQQTLASELDQAVATSGFKPDTPQARFLRQTLENEVRVGVANNRFAGHTDESFRAGLRAWVATAKQHLAAPPPVPGTRPNLQVVDAPISAGGGTAAPANPQSTSPAAPRTFEEAMGNTFGGWRRNA